MIFKTYEKYNKKKNTITDEIGLAGLFEGKFLGLQSAKKGQQDFNKAMFEKDLKAQQNYVDKFISTYDTVYNDAVSRSISADMAKVEAMEAANKAIEVANDETKRYCVNTDRATMSADHFAKSSKKDYDAQNKAAKGFKGLSASTKALGLNLGADLAIGLAINGIVAGLQKLDEVFKITDSARIEAMETAVNDYNGAIEKSEANISTIKSLEDEFTTLSKGVNDAGENVSLSADQYERYNQIVSELTAINPSLISGYTAEGKAIVNRNKAIQEGIDLQQKYINDETKKYIESGGDILSGTRAKQRPASSEMIGHFNSVKDILKDVEGGFYYGRSGGKSGTITSDIINKVLGEEINLNKMSIEQLGEIASKKEQIIGLAQKEGGYSQKNIESLTKELNVISEQYNERKAQSAELAKWLQVAAFADESIGGLGLANKIPTDFSEGYSEALKKIAESPDLSTDDMLKESKDLANELNRINSNGTLSKFTDDIEKAQDTFRSSNKNARDVKAYNEAIKENISGIEALADTYNTSMPELSGMLDSYAADLADFASRKHLDIGEVFGTAASDIESARTVKQRFDEAMANGDYDTAINGFKEIYDVMYDGTNNRGRGSLAWWEGAEMFLGADRLKELGYDFGKVNAAVKELQPTMKSSAQAAANFGAELWELDGKEVVDKKLGTTTKRIKDEFGDTIATLEKDVDGAISFDVPNENLGALAEKLKVSKDYLVAMIDASRQFSNVTWDNTQDVAKAIQNMDSTKTVGKGKDRKSFQLYDNVEKEAGRNGITPKEFSEIATKIEDETNVSLINTKDSVQKLVKQFSELNPAIAQFKKSKDGMWAGALDASGVVSDMKDMGATTEETAELLQRFKKDKNVALKGLDKGTDVKDFVNKEYDKLNAQEAEMNVDVSPVDKATSSVDQLTAAIEKLTVAMGGIPDLNVDADVDSATKQLYKLQKGYDEMSDTEKASLQSGINKDISNIDSDIKRWEKDSKNKNLSAEQKQNYEAAIKNAQQQKKILEGVQADLTTGNKGELDWFKLDGETGRYVEDIQAIKNEIDGITTSINEMSRTEKSLQKFGETWNSLTAEEREQKSGKIEDQISSYESQIGQWQALMDSGLLNDEQEGIVGKGIDDATNNLNRYKDLLDDLKDDGKINDIQDDEQVNSSIKLSDDGAQAKLDKFKSDIEAVDNKEVTTKCEALVNSGNLDSYVNMLNLTPEEKETVLRAITAGAEGDLDTFITEFDKLPPEVQTQISMAIQNPGEIGNLIKELGDLDGTTANASATATFATHGDPVAQKAAMDNAPSGSKPSNATSSFKISGDPLAQLSAWKNSPSGLRPSNATSSFKVSGDPAYQRNAWASAPSGTKIATSVVNFVTNTINKVKSVFTSDSKGTPNRRKNHFTIPSKAEGNSDRRKSAGPIYDYEKEILEDQKIKKDKSHRIFNKNLFDSRARGGGKHRGGPTLTGELAPELVWIPSAQKAMIVGQMGPEMVNLPSDAVVYPGDETRRILAGRNTHKEFNSFASGSLPSGGHSSGGGSRGGNSGSRGDKSDGSNVSNKAAKNSSKVKKNTEKTEKAAKKTKEYFDWIEVKLDRIQRKIEKYDKIANRTNWIFKTRLKNYDKEYKAIKREITLQNQGYKRYIKQSKKVKLSSKWKKKVRAGKIDIDTIKKDKLKERIKDYQEWYEKALDCRDAIVDLKTKLAELQKEKFDAIVIKFEGKLARNEFRSNMLDEKINQAENKGYMVSTNYYSQLKSAENYRSSQLTKQKKELQSQLNKAVSTGHVRKYSEMWWEMIGEINDVTLAIEESKTKITEFDDAIREINYEIFDHMQERISQITQEGDFLIDLMSNDKLYEDNGQLTDQGMATMGLHGVNYNTYMAQADKYAAELKKVQDQLDKDQNNTKLIERRNELLKLQQESIMSAEQEKDAIVDLVEEGIDKELDALDELIDKYTDALKSQKDLYDYQQDVKKQTEEIATLQKRLAAYANDDSEEAKQKIQEIKVSLEEAEQDLKDTQYDHYIDAQEELLDELYTQYEEILNMRLDNIDILVSDMIDKINTNSSTINTTIKDEAYKVGYNITNEMSNIWGQAGTVISNYGEKFLESNNRVVSIISAIHTSVNTMVSELNNAASKEANSITSTSKKPNSGGGNGDRKYLTSLAKSEKELYGKKPSKGKKDDLKLTSKKIKNKPSALNNNNFKFDFSSILDELNFNKSAHAYKKGKKRIPKKQLAWTNERTSETIIRKSDGAILTPLKAGDMVLNTAAHSNIWSMANDPSRFIKEHFDFPIPMGTNINTNSNDNYNVENEININLENVNSYEDFVYAMQHDKKFEKMIQDISINQLFGGSSLKKYKY